ncbi:hypothetical protein M2139_000325 [Enterococcus sp. PF1-24]|uniref:hypothetical protein n=1 Tax=unclassified Enterococcus TaxID=2608891 RepID=UPI00247683FF|nr:MULTISPECIES: hypothetical protein [unclassified Enterococcus]MDH6363255.1 hypothetical protein [Enterococcus sp. PFB1-1]MDH6400444.1 hypothetical protein [Enterococcus sp. PF1-24]
MKKTVSLFVLSLFLLLAGCSGNSLEASSFDKVEEGMKEEKVVEVLGKPSKTLSKQEEIATVLLDEFNASMRELNGLESGDKNYKAVEDKIKAIANLQNYNDLGSEVKVLQYEYKADKEEITENLVFYKDELISK